MEKDVTFDDISYKFRVGVIIAAVSTLFHLVGMGSSHWALTMSPDYGTVEFSGLWEKCADLNLGGLTDDFQCRGFVWEDVQVSHWFRTIQTMQVMSFLGMVTVLILSGCYMFVSQVRQMTALRVVNIFLSFLCGLFIISTCIVFGALKDVQKARTLPDSYVVLSWSFGFALFGGIVDLILAVVFVIGK